ncbi:MAG: hypothetical protein FJ100_02205 [Deltaproteobacteria bacterium]|nr:hypothetical protein [Deltaproteobacteria bacterium]
MAGDNDPRGGDDPTDKLRQQLEERLKQSKGFRFSRWILPVLALLVVMFGLGSGGAGLVEIEPGEVAVIYNTTGLSLFGAERRVIREQGTVSYVPWFQRVETLDIRPQILTMEGDRDPGDDKSGEGRAPNKVRRLTVRANDGSNFWFGKLEIHYQLDPAKADVIIETHGSGDAYKSRAVLTHSREILRDEFGRYSFLQAADPSTYSKATSLSKNTLNARLKPTGIEISQILTPKPSFDQKVETAIKDRQTAEQAVLVNAKQRERLVKEKDRKIQEIRESKNAEFQTLLAELAAQQQQAQNQLVSVQREADKYSIGRVAEGKAVHAEKTTRAAAAAEAARERAQGLAAKINSVGAAGPDVLNLEIAKSVFPQLEKISAVPFARPVSTALDVRQVPAVKGE